jgi:hypothetical protein
VLRAVARCRRLRSRPPSASEGLAILRESKMFPVTGHYLLFASLRPA